jgi:hypothetical protein
MTILAPFEHGPTSWLMRRIIAAQNMLPYRIEVVVLSIMHN